MEDFFTNAVIWFIVGLVFFLLEFAIPGFILFFFGLAAWIVAILTLFFNISINVQLILFLGSAVISVAFFRNWIKNKLGMNKEAAQVLDDEIIGKTAIAETAIAPGKNGKVDFRGTSWDAASDDYIEAGENVRIIANRSILLIVKSTKTL